MKNATEYILLLLKTLIKANQMLKLNVLLV